MRERKPIATAIRQSLWRAVMQPKIWLRCQQWRHQMHMWMQCWRAPDAAYRPLFIIATARSGSNLLRDFVSQLPGVACRSEVLCTHRAFGISPRQYHPAAALKHIQRSLLSLPGQIRGCKLMLTQMAACRLTIDTIDASFPEARYLVLYRKSLGEQFLSRESALLTGQWLLLDGEARKQAGVHIDPAKLRSFADETRQAYESIVSYAPLRERGVLLSYEELTGDPAACFRERICPLLGVPAMTPKSAMRKQNVLPLEQRVVNYHEVADLLNRPLLQQHYAWPAADARKRAA
jgi:LPS sulfotransferase NodH